jgi:hypothetical protein
MKSRRKVAALAVVLGALGMLLAAGLALTAFAQAPVPSGDIFPDVWAPASLKWENGNPSGYTEGETAAMVVRINNHADELMLTEICLQVVELQSKVNYYGFTAFEPFTTTYTPPNFPAPNAGVAIDFGDGNWDQTHPFIWAYNAVINSVSAPALGTPCGADYLGVTVTFTPNTGVSYAYLAYGGHLARPGDPLPAGAPDASVPDGRGSSQIKGTFQTSNATGGLKTINFKGTLIQPAAPAIAIEKYTNGEDADNPTGPYIPVGDGVSWTYVVSNTGDSPLSLVSVTDDQGVIPDCPQTTLAPGELMTCSASGTAVAGQYANLATATGWYNDAPYTASDPSHYFGSDASIDIEKSTNGDDADTPTGPYIPVGDAVNWLYVVTNDGNVELTGITVTDSEAGVTPSCPKTTLAPAESMNCTASGAAVAGQYDNLGTATGTPAVGDAVSDEDPSHYFGVVPSIDIEKSVSVDNQATWHDADEPTGPCTRTGEAVYWKYVVTNDGNAPLTDVEVTDTKGVAVDCGGKTTLDPSEVMICYASGTAIEGQYINQGTAKGYFGTTMVSDFDLSHYLGLDPCIDVTKTHLPSKRANGDFLPGDKVTYVFKVTNCSSSTDLNNVTVVDEWVTPYSGQRWSWNLGAIGAGSNRGFSEVYTVPDDAEAGLVLVNKVIADGADDCGRGDLDTATDEVVIGQPRVFVPEWDSILLLASGLGPLAAYASMRFRKRR